MAKGHPPSPAARAAWERNRKAGQILYGIGLIKALADDGTLTQAEADAAIAPLQQAEARRKALTTKEPSK